MKYYLWVFLLPLVVRIKTKNISKQKQNNNKKTSKQTKTRSPSGKNAKILTLCSLSPYIRVQTHKEDIIQCNDVIFEFLVKRRFQRIPTCHFYF